MKAKKKSGEVYLDVTKEQYRAMQAKGIDEEALLKPGRHKFVRGLFKKMHPDYDSQKTKVRISIYVDADVLAYFRARAAQPNAAPYQTQINSELRAIMEREAVGRSSALAADYSALLDNPEFIAAVAERVRRRTPSRKRGRKAA